MNEPVSLRPEDRPAFESALRQALDAPDIRAALGRPDAPYTVDELRARALAAADSLTAEASSEYAALLGLRSDPARGEPPADGEGAGAVMAALVVLTPLLSATAAAIFLLLGYGLRLAGTAGPLAGTLVGTGWTAAAVAAVAGLGAGAGLAFTAARHRTAEPGVPPSPDPLAQARAAWLRALLQRGLLPHLRRETGLAGAAPGPAGALPAPAPGPRPGSLGRPDRAGPDLAGPARPSRG